MTEYAVIYEQGATSWGAWVPDLPGCVAAGETRAEAEELIREAIEAHIENLREHGEPVPPPSSHIGAVQVRAA
jgi:predicted RNase H-like HicB family nuclease